MIGILRDLIEVSRCTKRFRIAKEGFGWSSMTTEDISYIDADLLLENIEKVRDGTFYKPEDSQNNQDKTI